MHQPVKQIALAWQLHSDTHGCLPSGGWGYNYMADPDRGFGKNQSGSWAYSCLPYMEEQAIHQIGAGVADPTAKKAALAMLKRNAGRWFLLPVASPTDRHAVDTWRKSQGFNADYSVLQARSDYAANLGPAYNDSPTGNAMADGGPSSSQRRTRYWFLEG